ncbi:MAG: glycosyltransferase involved in cell wall biosynthesis [Psychromonas sp.]|jgi:glycosyltransferase involved in cell wall biosynthesis
MACGVPVIATNVSDNGKIITHLSSGYLVETNNVQELSEKTSQLLGDVTTLETFSENARKEMEKKFSSRKLAENMTQIYEMIKQR